MRATSSLEVVTLLQQVIDDAIATGDRLGYFAALYKRMTLALRDAMAGGRFRSPATVEALDVAFANRYFEARAQYFAGTLDGLAWRKAYDASRREGYAVLQHLLLSINPHVMLDLGVATALAVPADQLEAFRGDFEIVNEVLTSLMPTVDSELDTISPVTAVIDHVFGSRGRDRAVGAAVIGGREAAWRLATRLSTLDDQGRAAAIADRDREASLFADVLLWSHDPYFRITGWHESSDVAANIRTLDAPAS